MGVASAAAAQAALERVRVICRGFPGTEEKLSHGAPAFHVRGKMFVSFVHDHHGDGRLAAWCKASPAEQQRLVREQPGRYFVPPYVGVRGWVGVHLGPETDWVQLAMIVEEGWLSVAPPRLLRGDAPPPAPRPSPPPLPTTDPAVARAALERLRGICLALPGAELALQGSHASFLVGRRIFAYFLDNHHGDARIVACFRGARGDNERLARAHPGRYTLPAYLAPRGWLGVRLDGKKVDWKEIATRAGDSYLAVAPRRRAARAHRVS